MFVLVASWMHDASVSHAPLVRRLLVVSLSLLAPACTGADAGAADAGAADAGAADARVAGDAGPLYPPTLSATGLYRDAVGGPLADGVSSYEVRHPLWSDGSSKRRFLLLPGGGTIDTADPDGWRFPVGTRVFKEFAVDGRAIETRLLWKVGEGEWVRVSYVHRADGSDADAAPEGAVDALGTEHDVPDAAACFNCHRGAADFVLGISALQLDRASFDAWSSAGVIPSGTRWAEPPGDEVQRGALGYLHANCGPCHVERHPLAMHRALRLSLPVAVDDPLETPAWRTSVGQDAFHEIGGARQLLVPGDPDASQIYVRMGVRGELGMPPVGTERLDETGRAAVARWIRESSPP